jgi:hypothetical protein
MDGQTYRAHSGRAIASYGANTACLRSTGWFTDGGGCSPCHPPKHLIDIRGRIVPDLHEQSNAIAANVKCLEDRFGSFDTMPLGISVTDIADRLVAFRAEFDT